MQWQSYTFQTTDLTDEQRFLVSKVFKQFEKTLKESYGIELESLTDGSSLHWDSGEV